jgi:hypothetical protein
VYDPLITILAGVIFSASYPAAFVAIERKAIFEPPVAVKVLVMAVPSFVQGRSRPVGK